MADHRQASFDKVRCMEQSFVAWAKMRARRLPQVKLGIGDDAAVIDSHGQDLVVTTDSIMDGVHFRLSEVRPRRVGKKAISVNLSDLAAMGAEPAAVFLSLCLPRLDAQTIAAEIFEGVCEQAHLYQVAVAGGDTNCWDGPLVVHITAVGKVVDNVVWTRSGARVGDAIVVTGPLGGSLLGKHLDFAPRLDLAAKLRSHRIVSAAMDISDGLTIDLLRMADASGCGALLDLDRLPISAAARQLAGGNLEQALQHALGDGEDFELILAIAAADLEQARALVGADNIHVVGEFISRTGLWARDAGRYRQLPATGYVHQ